MTTDEKIRAVGYSAAAALIFLGLFTITLYVWVNRKKDHQ